MKKIKAIIKLSIGVALFTALYIFISNEVNILSNLKKISVWQFLIGYGLTCITFFCLSQQNKLLLDHFGVNLSRNESYHLTLNNALVNAVIPFKASLAFRWLYLKKVHNLANKQYFSFTFQAIAIQFISAAIIAIFTFSIYSSAYLVIAILAVTILIFAVVKRKIRAIVAKVVILNTLFLVTSSLRIYLFLIWLETPIDFLWILLINSLLIFILFINLTAGNLGIKEGGIFLIAQLMSLPASDLIVAALLDRIISYSVLITMGLYSTYILSKNIKP